MKIVVAVAGVTTLAFVVGIALLGADAASSAATAPDLCFTSGPVPGLGSAPATNARLVTAVAEQYGGHDAAVIAVMTGYTESGLRVLGNLGVIGLPSSQGDGSDHDSLGIFQQRASWGTAAQRMDPVQSTELFVRRLVAVPAWRAEQPWVVAQDVQVSAYDGRPRAANNESSEYGGNYRANLPLAQRIVEAIDQDAAAAQCGALSGGLPANTAAGSHGLPSRYLLPADATPAEAQVVLFAIAQLDKPYVFGAAGPAAYDCSGLVLAAWAQAGIILPHNTVTQVLAGTATTPARLAPGDLVFVAGDDGTLAAPGHVGIYIGAGLVLNAADEQAGIRVQTYSDFLRAGHGLSALRHLG